MWDKPDALNLIANVLFAAAALLLAYGVLHFAMRLPFFPLREIRITEAPLHVTPEQIEEFKKLGDERREKFEKFMKP